MTRPLLPVTGLHHVKVPVADLARSRAWYEALLGLKAQLEFRDDDGTVRGVSYHPLGEVRLALREDPVRATAMLGWDPVAFAVRSRTDLGAVAERLDELAVEHGPIIEATLGWLLAATGPDGQQVRFYTLEHHPEAQPTGIDAAAIR